MKVNSESKLQAKYPAEYTVWLSMRKYAKRSNLKIAKAWETFEGFIKSVGRRPSDHHRFTRADKSKGFVETNAAWKIGENVKSITIHGKPYVISSRSKKKITQALDKHAERLVSTQVNPPEATGVSASASVPPPIKWRPEIVLLDSAGNQIGVKYSEDGLTTRVSIGATRITVHKDGSVMIKTFQVPTVKQVASIAGVPPGLSSRAAPLV